VRVSFRDVEFQTWGTVSPCHDLQHTVAGGERPHHRACKRSVQRKPLCFMPITVCRRSRLFPYRAVQSRVWRMATHPSAPARPEQFPRHIDYNIIILHKPRAYRMSRFRGNRFQNVEIRTAFIWSKAKKLRIECGASAPVADPCWAFRSIVEHVSRQTLSGAV
jgi:hypothetical protein